MPYVDGVLVPVKSDKKEEYRKFAEVVGAHFKGLGATAVVDCWGDDVPEGKLNSMQTAVLLEKDESVVFSWIYWPSKEIRDKAWAEFEEDGMGDGLPNPPFEGTRMIFGGFQVLVDA